ncbi:MAG: hypothetical protein M0Q51_14635 [Bacteroidales bacterium]|nr:hypothetical protein [Bacteroidales bacterium]
MKKIALLPVIFLCVSLICSSQVPHAFKYQAVIRDTTGVVISNQLVSLRISLLRGDINGEVSYSEIHDVITNTLGLVNLEIGRGLVVAGEFAQISWGEDNYFIQLEIDMQGAMNYQLLGTSQLLAVPYALYAEKSGSGSDTIKSQWKESGEGIYYDEGNVGINQADPQYSLDMSGMLNVNGDGRVSNTFQVGLNNFNVTSDGKVGIGTSLPFSNLQIEGTSVYTSNRRFLQIRNNATDGHSAVILWMNAGTGNSSTFLAHHAASYSLYDGKYSETSQLWNDGRGLFFRTRPESKFIFETYDGGQYSIPVEIMRITGDGKIGIGTENPEVPLQIEGRSYNEDGRNFLFLKNNSTDGFSCVYVKLKSGDGNSSTDLTHHSDSYSIFGGKYAGTSALWNSGNGLILRTNPEGRISFETTDRDGRSFSELMRITGDGKIGLGTENPEAVVQVEGESVGQSGRNFLWLKNNSTDNFSTVWLQLSSGDDSRTTLQHRGDYYTLYGDEWRQTALLWNEGKGLIFRTSLPGKIYFEFYDGQTIHETARFTSDGRLGIGTKDPQRTLHINDVMRLEPRSTPPENPAEGDIYMDSSDHRLKVFDGTTWQSCW